MVFLPPALVHAAPPPALLTGHWVPDWYKPREHPLGVGALIVVKSDWLMCAALSAGTTAVFTTSSAQGNWPIMPQPTEHSAHTGLAPYAAPSLAARVSVS